MGKSTLTGPNTAARSKARNCVRNIGKSERLQRMALSPSAGLAPACVPSNGLSAPTSIVRMVTGRPFIPSTTER